MVEETSSECDLLGERFNRVLDRGRLLLKHRLEVRSDDLQYQYVMFPIRALDPEMIQEGEDTLGPRMSPRLRRKVTVDPYLVVPAGKFCHCEFEGDVSTVLEKDR